MPMTQFATTLSDYIRAGYPAIAVTTHEEERLLRDLQTLKDVGWSFASWSAVRGWRDPEGKAIQGTTAGATAPTAVLEIQKLLKKTVAVFFDLQTHFVTEPDTIRAIRDALEIAKSSFRPMLLCSPYSTLPLELEKDVALLDYALPMSTQLRELIPELLKSIKQAATRASGTQRAYPTDLEEGVIETMINAARGLTWNEAESAFSLAIMTAVPDTMPTVVQREKTSLVRKQGLLELIEPKLTLDAVGGLDPLKEWLIEQGALIKHAAEALAWGFVPEDLPKGALLTGLPGTGKSLIARAAAATWGLPLLRLDMSRILGSLVGQSENRMRDALRLAEAMAPCVLHCDEIEKALAGAGTDTSGVSTRIVGQLLTWLQERGVGADGLPSPVYVIATANNPDSLPAPLLRPGRFDGRWFVDLPQSFERRVVAQIHLVKRRQSIVQADLDELVEQTRDYSPAEIEQIVKTGCAVAFRERRGLVAKDLFDAVKRITPLSKSRQEDLEKMREEARRTGALFANAPEAGFGASRRLLDLG